MSKRDKAILRAVHRFVPKGVLPPEREDEVVRKVHVYLVDLLQGELELLKGQDDNPIPTGRADRR